MATSFNPNARPSLARLASEIELHKKLIDNGIVPSCISCEHWGMNHGSVTGKPPKEEICRLYNIRPPATVITLGCKDWDWDIPF